jgi:hypothetical protein
MRVLFCIRKDYLKNFAGDIAQLNTMASFLKRKGISVNINCGLVTDYSSYDLIHLFNLTRISETYEYYKIACEYKKPIVLTPVFWDLTKYYKLFLDY